MPLQNGCAWPSAKSGVTMATVLSVKQLTSDDAVKRTLTLTLDVSVGEWKPVCEEGKILDKRGLFTREGF